MYGNTLMLKSQEKRAKMGKYDIVSKIFHFIMQGGLGGKIQTYFTKCIEVKCVHLVEIKTLGDRAR